jgi:hypothetical protein
MEDGRTVMIAIGIMTIILVIHFWDRPKKGKP